MSRPVVVNRWRELDELVHTNDPGWPLIQELLATANNHVEVLPPDRARAEQTLVGIQISTSSFCGAVAYETGGLLVDHGWLRILGSGHPRLQRDLATWNFPKGHRKPHRLHGAMLVAEDVLGGFFAVNGGAFGGGDALGNVFYLSPDSLRWGSLSRGYPDFINFALNGDLGGSYRQERWSGWQTDVANLPGDRGIVLEPYLWADGGPLEGRTRKTVPIEELWSLNAIKFPKMLAAISRERATKN